MRLLLPIDIAEIKRLLDGGEREVVLAERYGLPRDVIHAIATGAIPIPAAAAAQPEDLTCSH